MASRPPAPSSSSGSTSSPRCAGGWSRCRSASTCPYWIEDPDFDIDFHVRNLALPSPGNDEQLAEQVARIVSRPLDRTRPLWELYVIEGLEHGYVAGLTKIHHATIDGASGAQMLTVLLDQDPDYRPSGYEAPWEPEDVPSDAAAPPAHGHRVPAAAREAGAAQRPHAPRAGRHHRQRRPAGHGRHGRPAAPRPARRRPPPAAARRQRGGPPAGPAAHRRAPHAVQPHDRATPALRLHLDPAEGRQGGEDEARHDVQRRGDGAVLVDPAPLPGGPRRAAGGAAHRHGAGEHPQRRRGRDLPEPRVGPAGQPGHRREGPDRAGHEDPGVDELGQGHARRDPGRDAAGLHAVRPAGDRRPGDADVQPHARSPTG